MYCLGGLLKEKQVSTSDTFSNFQKTYWPPCPIVQWEAAYNIILKRCLFWPLVDNGTDPKVAKIIFNFLRKCCREFRV